MMIVVVSSAADETNFVHRLGHVWQKLADLQTVDVRGNRLIFATYLFGCARLQIETVVVGQATAKVDQNDRLGPPMARDMAR